MAEKKTSLRVLYTINSSHQYILARSHLPVTVAVIPPVDDNQGKPSTASQSVPLYASVSLRTCLDTICRSSPELTMLDNTRDFSVYVLDPLESNSAPTPVHIPNGDGEGSATTPPPAQPRGVAVGLGLMSWTLMADERDAASVVGTLVKQGTRQEALEVIFSLRETAGTKKPMWSTSSTSSQLPSSQESVSSFSSSQGEGNPLECLALNQVRSSSSYRGVSSTSTYSNQPFHDEATRETLTSIQTRTRPKSKPVKPVRQSKVPVTGSDQFMDADTYIGPAKKKGRPKTTIAEPRPGAFQGNTIASGSGSIQPEVIVIDSDSDAEWGTPTPTAGKVQPACNRAATSTKRKPTSQHPITPPFTTDPLVRHPPQSEPNSTTFQVKVEPEESGVAHPSENATILATLSAIDSSVPHFLDHAVPNPALASRVRHLLALYRTHLVPSIPGPSAPTPPTPTPPTPAPPSSSQQHQQHRRSSSSSQNEIVVLDKENVNPVAFKKPAGKDSYDTGLSDPVAKASLAIHLSRQNTQPERHVKGLGPTSRSNEAQPARLSMNLPNQSSGLGRKRTLSDTMDEKERRHREKGKQRERRDGHRQSSSQYPRLSVGSDVLRHYPRLRDSNEPRIEQPSNYYRTPLESLTSPARPPSEGDDEAPNPSPEPFRSTSPIKPHSPRLPRVSASSPVRAPRQSIRKGYVVPEWAVTNTATQPRLSEEAQRAQLELEEKKKQEKRERSKLKRNRSTSALQAKMRPPEVRRLPKEAEPICGPIAASNAGPLIAATDITFPILASSRSSSPPPNPIFIPKTPKTPTRNRSIRVTPGGENDSLFTPGPASGSLFGSSYCRHSPQGSPPSYLTSPLGNRKKPRMSPRPSSLTDRSLKPFTNANDSEERQEAKSLPHPEAEDVLEDLDCPPDSLPFASSDTDIDEVSQQPSAGFDFDARTPVKQHWPGLPPSSPPAPSSPLLQPDFDLPSDDEMAEVPIATSDSEADADMSAFESDATSPTGYNPPYSNDQLTTAMDHELFSFFSADTHSLGHQITTFPSMDLFEQYTNLNAQSDDMQTFTTDNSNLNELLQNGLDGMDYTEFWETFNPLVADNTHLVPQSTDADLGAFLDGADNPLLPSFGEVDHNKLAEDMHALLGGCVM